MPLTRVLLYYSNMGMNNDFFTKIFTACAHYTAVCARSAFRWLREIHSSAGRRRDTTHYRPAETALYFTANAFPRPHPRLRSACIQIQHAYKGRTQCPTSVCMLYLNRGLHGLRCHIGIYEYILGEVRRKSPSQILSSEVLGEIARL